MRKVYMDRVEIKDCIGVFVPDAEVILTGTTINSMCTKYKNEEYQKYADDYDIHFIFDDDIPVLTFYTVPQVDILARDSKGGFIVTVGQQSDLDSDAPICYINNQHNSFLIAKTGKEFLKLADSWKHHLNHIVISFFTVRNWRLKKNSNLLRLPRWK